jgi:hypothetical protein
LVLHQCLYVVFPSHATLVEEMMHAMVTKTMQLHVLSTLVEAKNVSINFDLWMFKHGVDTFALQSIT